MDNIQVETILFFAKQVVISLRDNLLKLNAVNDIGKSLFEDVIEYLEENQEITKEELELLKKYKAVFTLSHDEIWSMDCILLDIKEGNSHWQKPPVSSLIKLLEHQFVNEDESVRYLAHHNYYQEVMEICEDKPELLQLAKKYGSERTRINFKNYETMKVLESRLTPLGKKEKREKI